MHAPVVCVHDVYLIIIDIVALLLFYHMHIYRHYITCTEENRLPTNKNFIQTLEAYASALEEKIFRESNLKEKCHRNLTKEEQKLKALEDLRSCDDIVIKQADKGSRKFGLSMELINVN